MEALKGRKTYLIAALLMLVGLVKVLTGEASGWEQILQNADVFLGGAGLATIRAGITKGPAK